MYNIPVDKSLDNLGNCGCTSPIGFNALLPSLASPIRHTVCVAFNLCSLVFVTSAIMDKIDNLIQYNISVGREVTSNGWIV
jgi:hypothetical protein